MNKKKRDEVLGTVSAVDGESAVRYQYLVENIQDAVVEFEFVDETPIVRDVNDAFVETFGYDAADVCGDSLNAWIVPDDLDGQASELDERTERGEITSQEVTRQTATGRREFLHRSVPYEDPGPVDGIALYTDITERKRAQRKRQLLTEVSRCIGEAETLRDGFETALQAICSYTEWTYGEVWQPAVAAEELQFLVGYTEHAACESFLAESRDVTFPVGDGLPGRVYESASSEWLPDVSHESPAVFHRTDSAAERGLHAAFGTPVVADGTVVAVLVFFLRECRDCDERLVADLTDVSRNLGELVARKQAEETIKRQNERLAEFANVISHDLRNPLNVAMSHREIVADERDSPHLDQMATAHTRMAELIDDILTLAREGRAVADQETLSLRDCVARSWKMLETTDATLQLETDQTILGDTSRVQQLFENLLRNAIDHSPAGVTITVGDSDAGFYVADDGPGIPRTEREKVFDLGHTTRAGGTGLGLSLVRDIADAHGWALTVTESAAGGARFEFESVTVEN